MGLRFVKKSLKNRSERLKVVDIDKKEEVKEQIVSKPIKNKKVKKENNMITMEQIEAAERAAEYISPEVKVVKADRGLIERTESSKIILTEDNRQVLND